MRPGLCLPAFRYSAEDRKSSANTERRAALHLCQDFPPNTVSLLRRRLHGRRRIASRRTIEAALRQDFRPGLIDRLPAELARDERIGVGPALMAGDGVVNGLLRVEITR